MMKKILYPIWAALYVICAGLGAITERSAAGEAVLTIISVLFFVPGFWLLALFAKEKDRKQIKYLHIISGVSLGLTVLALVGNILSFMGSVTLGNVLFGVLVVVSVPMMCCKWWVLPLFIWAVFFWATSPLLRGKQPQKP